MNVSKQGGNNNHDLFQLQIPSRCVFYKETVNGRTNEYALCHECAAKLNLTSPITAFSDDDPLTSLFSAMLARPGRAQEEKRCPACGSRFKELASAGKLGCPTCYEAFADELSATVHQLHGNVKTRGRAPRRFGEKQRREEELARLKAEMKTAIETQEFEKAAELRDRIRALEGGN